MSTAKDIVATIGTYTDKQGQTKYVSRKVGSLIETRKGPRIKLDASFTPAGCKRDEDGGVWLAIFDQRENATTCVGIRAAASARSARRSRNRLLMTSRVTPYPFRTARPGARPE